MRWSGCLAGDLDRPLTGPQNADQACHANQVSQRGSLHLLHHARAVDLHGLHRDPEIHRDLLVRPSGGDEGEDLPFAPGQVLESRSDLGELAAPLGEAARVLEAAGDRLQQQLGRDGFLENVDRAALHRQNGPGHISLRGQEHQSEGDATGEDVRPAPERIQLRDLHLTQDTAGASQRGQPDQQTASAGECLGGVTRGANEMEQPLPYRVVPLRQQHHGLASVEAADHARNRTVVSR